MIMFLCVIRTIVNCTPAICYNQIHVQCGQIGRQVSFAGYSSNIDGGIRQGFEFFVQRMAMPRAHVVSFYVGRCRLWVRNLQFIQALLCKIQDGLERSEITHKDRKLSCDFDISDLDEGHRYV